MSRAACIGAAFALTTFALGERAHADQPAVEWLDANDERAQPDHPQEAPKHRRIAAFQLAGTGAVRSYFEIPFVLGGGEAAVVITPRSRLVSVDIAFGYLRGESPNGVGMGEARLTGTVSRIFDRLRLGGGLGWSYLSIMRVTSGQTIARAGLNLHIQGSYDIVQSGEFALFVRPRVDVEPYWGGSGTYGASGSLGARF
jgi:hypothetical protein